MANDYVVDFPTLGFLAADWVERHCVIPDGFQKGQPYTMADWQLWCVVNHYRVKETATWVPQRPILGPAFHYRRSQIVAPQKALALDTPIATPGGWTTMAEVASGDYVFDEQGQPTRVISKSQVWETTTYRVTFSDGATLYACGDHQWWVERRTPSGTFVEDRVRTEDLIGNLTDKHGARRFRVPNAKPLTLPEANLPIDPYVLGAWLGDGNSDDGRLTGLDREHIPAQYLRASEAQRWALLQGLMDTDGHADKRGVCEFTTTLPALRDGVMELLYSLGVKPMCYPGEAVLNGRVTGPKWRISFAARSNMPVFHLPRKQGRLKAADRPHAQYQHRRIVAVERVDTVPTQCLTVEAASHVFLAGREMIPTANTGKGPLAAAIIAVEAAGPALFAGWAQKGETYECADHGCPCGWYWEYEEGDPKGMPWPTPLIQLTATSDEQTANVYRPLQNMIRNGRLGEMLKIREGFIRLPNDGRIETVTASAMSRLGNPIVFALHDETQLYTDRNKLHYVAQTQRRGVAGMGGRSMETTNCWNPAEMSTAQRTFESPSTDIFRFYRKPPADLSYRNKRERRKIHEYVYEGSWWVDLDSIESEAAELLETDPAQAERFYGNRIVQGRGAWLPEGLWDSAVAADPAALTSTPA